MTKLTLSVDEGVVEKAKELAHARGTSVSAMFTNIVRSMAASRPRSTSLPPLTRKLSGIIKLPPDKDYRELVTDALMEKHGFKK